MHVGIRCAAAAADCTWWDRWSEHSARW